VTRVQGLAGRIRVFGVLETTSYLVRSGRIPQLASWGTTLLRVRPLVRLAQGQGSLVQLVRGRSGTRRGLQRVTERVARADGVDIEGRLLRCAVFHGDAGPDAELLRDALVHVFPAARIELREFTPAMGVHTGPGVLGTAFYIDAPEAAQGAVSSVVAA
jgi:fatty acid-binding protein DegV